MKGSWRTTFAGILTFVGAAIALVAVPLLDADPATVANWTGLSAPFGVMISLFFARDNKVKSESVGAE